MFVEVRTRHIPFTPELEARTSTQASRALARFAHAIRGVVVRIEDVNGPRGGIDKLCRATVLLKQGGSLIAEARSDRVGPAVGLALARARTQVSRVTERRQRVRLGSGASHLAA